MVRACADAGTDYADLTGDFGYLRQVIDECDAPARASGARIVPTCGVDSVPSDLGVWNLARRVAEDGEGELGDTVALVTARGTLGGGTVQALLGKRAAARADPAAAALLDDPYALSPDRSLEPDLGPQPDLRVIRRDPQVGQWVGPFLMGAENTRVVRRSNALLGYRYGRALRYREVAPLGDGRLPEVGFGLLSWGVGGLFDLVRRRRVGPAVESGLRRVLPQPGQGPDQDKRQAGSITYEFRARTTTGARYVEHVRLDGDPSFDATALILTEVGLCLASDGDDLPSRCGVLTPATAMDGALLRRLQAAGVPVRIDRRTEAPG